MVHAVDIKPLLRGWSHVVAFATVAVLGSILLVAASHASASDRMWLSLYVLGTLTMFGVSAMYHRVRWQPRAHSIMKRLDHSAIFFAIAGAYTPIAALALHGWQQQAVLVMVWGGALVGVALEWLPITVPRWLFTAVYVIVGWSAALRFLSCTRASARWVSGSCSAAGSATRSVPWCTPRSGPIRGPRCSASTRCSISARSSAPGATSQRSVSCSSR